MRDPRIVTLAKNLIHYSVRLQPGEKILIENIGLETEFVQTLIKEVYAVGAYPFVTLKDPRLNRALLLGAQPEQLKLMAKWESERMKEMDAYIGIRSGDNISELADVPGEKMQAYSTHYLHPVHSQIRVPHTK